MNVNGERPEAQKVNVVPLFGNFSETVLTTDPLTELLEEGQIEAMREEVKPARQERRKLVREDHFPEQGLLILDQQLLSLKESVSRIKFYMSDLDDLLPK